MMQPARRLALTGALLLTFLLAGARGLRSEDALIIQERFNPDALEASEALLAILEGLGYSVAVRAPELGEALDGLPVFACAFDLRPDLRPVLFEKARLRNFVQTGGGLLLAGEHAGFDFRNDALLELIEELGSGPLAQDPIFAPGPFRADYPQALNPGQALASQCRRVEEVVYDGLDHGRMTETGNGTWVTGSPAAAGMVAWDRDQLPLAPDGRLVLVLDIDFLVPSATLDRRLGDGTATENRALVENLAGFLCGRPGDRFTAPSCDRVCAPRNHGFWHRYCLGRSLIAPGRRGRGLGPPQVARFEAPADLFLRADALLAPFGVAACEALDPGPFADERQAALRELATLALNLAADLLALDCPVELHPVVRDAGPLDVADALRIIEEDLAEGSRRSLRRARWIGEHVANGEALLR